MTAIPTGQFITHAADETFELAYSIGEAIAAPAVFLLEGDLGAGKTVFAKGLAAGLDIDPAEVNSPTFTLVNQHEGRMRLYHLDLYRLDLYRIEGGAKGAYDLGLEEMFADPQSIVVIEWPERLGSFKLPNAYRVSIHDLGNDAQTRQIVVAES
jgi:tRNA threonylcarbamoyladenosine biosynthesis protein TsaE